MPEEFRRKVYHIEMQERVESVRMGLWYYLVTRSQGHLAHGVIGNGYKVLEFLKSLTCPLEDLNAVQFDEWANCVKPFTATLLETHNLLVQKGQNLRYCQQVWRLMLDLKAIGHGVQRAEYKAAEGQAKQEQAKKGKCEP